VAVTFRRLERGSLDLMLDLSAQLYAREGLGWNRARSQRAAEELIAEPERGGIWQIGVDGETAGYLVLTICFSLEFGGRFGLLDEIFIADAWRGRGIGSEALDFAAEWCRERGMAALRLEVWTGNAGAIRLYQRAGFALEQRHLMTKQL